MFTLKLYGNKLVVFTQEDMRKYFIKENNVIHLGDYNDLANGLYIGAQLTRGDLFRKYSSLDYDLIDFALPVNENISGRGVWYYGSSVYANKSIFGHFIPDNYVFNQLAIFAHLENKYGRQKK